MWWVHGPVPLETSSGVTEPLGIPRVGCGPAADAGKLPGGLPLQAGTAVGSR